MYLHVHTANEDGVAFYTSHGFSIGDTVKGCYRRLTPPDAYAMSLALAVAATPRLQGRISSALTDLTQLHLTHPWVPGAEDVRPTPDVLARKADTLATLTRDWLTFSDYIRVHVFGQAVMEAGDGSGRLCSVGEDSALAGAVVFAPNEFPYAVPRHWVLWYGPREGEVGEAQITADVAAQMASRPELAGRDFAWYVNPKMTVPEYFHVQVFIEP